MYSIERPGLADWWWEDKSVGLISTVSDCVDGCIGVRSFFFFFSNVEWLIQWRCCVAGSPTLWRRLSTLAAADWELWNSPSVVSSTKSIANRKRAIQRGD